MRQISEEAAAQLEDGPLLSADCKRVVADAIVNVLAAVGEDPQREGLLNTPTRVALLNGALFDVEYNQMVVVTDIEFYSLCEHHLLPIIGRAHVAYIPDKKVVGLSKIPRIVEAYARRLQVQERMTRQIADLIDELIQPLGVAVVVDGVHLCVAMRGAKKSAARMRTSELLGIFGTSSKTRAEFMQHIGPVHGAF